MKRRVSHPRNRGGQKVACTVSAAALMLGVSQAATIGLHFQCNYCGGGSANYSGAIVTATAFGVATNQWENLTQLTTGYNGCACGFTTLSQVIDTTTSSGGLNPLPNGSLTVTWGGYAANVSGFGGYTRSGPNYTFGGYHHMPGNEEVYWSFIRDGVNFGPIETNSCGYSAGDNTEPGYNVDITGLSSLFTNTSYAVQLIATSDSLWTLTNAFIIDAAANTTQSVVYPNIPTPANQGGTLFDGNSFPRGIGGGLSTSSGSFHTDHLKIIGNRTQHGVGFNRASTISGFIITDKPVISMSPQPIVICGGDTVTWSGYAVGVPPLSYQWRKNGFPVPGATNTDFSITNVASANIGDYDLLVTNLYGRATSSVVSVDRIMTTSGRNYVIDSNPKGPAHDGLNYGATWVATNLTQVGVMSFNAAHPDQIVVPGSSAFNSSTGAISFWMRTAGVANVNTNPATLIDRLNGNGCVLAQNVDGTLFFEAPGGTTNSSFLTITNNLWHNITLVYDQTQSGRNTLYIDGVVDTVFFTSTPWSWQVGQEMELGSSHDPVSWQGYNGLLDDVRVYNRQLTDVEAASIFATAALVDTNALVMRLDFEAPPTSGATLRWQCPDAILQSADSVIGPYTDVPSADSPYATAARGAKKFFRYHDHNATNIVTNPYLM